MERYSPRLNVKYAVRQALLTAPNANEKPNIYVTIAQRCCPNGSKANKANRTYKYHTRPRAGFKTFDGAVALTTVFVAFYNFIRPHSTLKNATPVALDALNEHSLMPDKWVALIEQAAA